MNAGHRTAARTLDVELTAHALPGTLTLPAAPVGLVVFAHGSGSSRLSPRNVQVANGLNGAGLATLLFDLLTPAEAERRDNVFDIDLLGERLAAATSALRETVPEPRDLPLGYFGASTGAAAALRAATSPDQDVRAIVSRGGRPDLAREALALVQAPTPLIVGGDDTAVLDLNREAQRRMTASTTELAVVPGAGHLFEEPGALEAVTDLASSWFRRHLPAGSGRA
jgi:putative phosphoribosyl transferase